MTKKTIDLDQLIPEIAKHLDGWTARTPHNAWLEKDDLAIHLDVIRHGRDAGRIEIRGTWPRSADNQVFYAEGGSKIITVAATKTPEQIAREIQRRFLPWYEEAYAEARRQADEHDAYQDASNRNALALATIGGATPSHQAPNEGTLSHDGIYIRYRCSGDHVRLTIDLPAAQALEVVRKAWEGTHGIGIA